MTEVKISTYASEEESVYSDSERTITMSKAPTDSVPELEFEYKEKKCYEVIKRALDLLLSLCALIVLSPLLIIVCIAVIIKDPGNPFFKQKRVGKDGKLFYMYKIRSMYKDAEEKKEQLLDLNECDAAFFKIKDDPRILGRLGKFLRKSSIDELPQLVNIVKGDMSIVGPRPFVADEQSQMAKERLLVKPGLSCYWQIYGKNMLSAEMSEYYDKKYIMDRGFLIDLKIIFKTFGVLFSKNND